MTTTQSERIAKLEQRLSDHEARCEERLAEIKSAAATMLKAVEGLQGRAWALAAALLTWALAQVWSANSARLEHLEAAAPPAAQASSSLAASSQAAVNRSI